jgi:pyruvate dehydrogenase (quinone)
LKHLPIEDPAACGAILDMALTAPGPVVVEAIVDADELTTPPKPQ